MIVKNLKINILMILAIVLIAGFTNTDDQTDEFYKTLRVGTLVNIQQQEKIYIKYKNHNESARLGALLMKKAEVLRSPKEKLNSFSEGKNLLEKAIEAAPRNIEFRFLRLIIQEKAPVFLKYSQNIKEDTELISSQYNTLNNILKEVVYEFALQSKHLKANSLK